jgi:hypothetical protein
MSQRTGRPPGRPPNVERKIRLRLIDSGEELIDAMLRQARLGDVYALRWCLDRLLEKTDETTR